MKADLETLRKALKACAEAHNAEILDWSETVREISIKSESVPTVSDVRMICRAFYGAAHMAQTGHGFTTVYLDEGEMLPEVDEVMLQMALPRGTQL